MRNHRVFSTNLSFFLIPAASLALTSGPLANLIEIASPTPAPTAAPTPDPAVFEALRAFVETELLPTPGIVMSLILSFSMACVALFRNAAAGFAIEALIRNWGTAFLTIMIVSLLFPVKEWGDRFAGACGLKPGTLPFGLASNLVPTLFFNTFITMVVAGVNVPGGFVSSLYWTAVANDFLPMFAVSYLLSLGAEKIGLSVAKKACAGGAEQLHL